MTSRGAEDRRYRRGGRRSAAIAVRWYDRALPRSTWRRWIPVLPFREAPRQPEPSRARTFTPGQTFHRGANARAAFVDPPKCLRTGVDFDPRVYVC